MNWPLNIVGFGRNVVTGDPAALRRGEAFINAGLRSGVPKPVIEATFDLADIAAAHRHMETNNGLGKIVVTVQHGARSPAPSRPSREGDHDRTLV
jgi:NADPH:quinone reductase-like Zn-dependent oxidoreductase